MKVIIAGSRKLGQGTRHRGMGLLDALVSMAGLRVTEVLSGGNEGMDRTGEVWARERGFRMRLYPAEWVKYGRSAGPRRNADMVRDADALIVVRYADSMGSLDVLAKARGAGLYVVDVVLPDFYPEEAP